MTQRIIAAHIESPGNGDSLESPVTVRGWCITAPENVRAIRAHANVVTANAVTQLPRPDVAARHPDQTQAGTSGFTATLTLAPGNHRVSVVAELTSGELITLGEREINARTPTLKAALETPSGTVPEGILRISGWCFWPAGDLLELRLNVGPQTTCTRFGLDRSDVAEAFPGIAPARRSGFEAVLKPPAGTHHVRVEAIVMRGAPPLQLALGTIRIRGTPPVIRVMRATARMAQGIGSLGARTTRWAIKLRRPPSMEQLRRLIARSLGELRGAAIGNGMTVTATPGALDPYACWIDVNRWTAVREAELRATLAEKATRLPRFSIVMPIYNPPLDLLDDAVDSIKRQVYGDWELCMADDCSTAPLVRTRLAAYASADQRICVVERSENGNISKATNSAAALATGEFLVFVDQDDLITPDCLAEVALALRDHPECDLLYTDDDKIDAHGRRYAPQFKPDWSPELLLSYMYLGHVLVVRRTLFESLGGFRVGFEGSQDFDFALRASEQARQIVHVPRVLYHWRAIEGSTATSGAAKPASFEAGRRAVQEALIRRGANAVCSRPDWAEQEALGIFEHRFPDAGPSITIIIPTRNQVGILRTCVESLKQTRYSNYKILIVDNASDDPQTLKYLAQCGHRVVRIPNPNGHFSYAYINNRAVELANTDYVLFLNNDIEVKSGDWLSQMAGYLQLEGVGAIGARLLYPDGRIQHAGIVHGYYDGAAGPAFKLLPSWNRGYLSYAAITRNYSAVTAACLLTRRDTFLDMDGFNEQMFPVAYNDVDYCYRLIDRGLRCVYTASAELVHHEGFSRGFRDNPRELAAFKARYSTRRDPYYSDHLSLTDERFEIAATVVPLRRPRRPIRSLMCTFNLNLEGAANSQYEMTVALAARGIIAPTVFAPADGPLRRLYEAAGIRVMVAPHPMTDAINAQDYDRAIATFADYIKQEDFEIVYGNTLQTYYAIAAAKRADRPSIWNPRESESWRHYFDWLGPEIAPRALACFEHPYRIVFVAHATAQVFSELNRRRNFSVIPNGLNMTRLESERARWTRADARTALECSPEQIVVLLLGTVCERKGQLDLIEAARLMPDDVLRRCKLVIVGDRDSPYSRQLNADAQVLAQSRGAQILIIKETEDTSRYYQAADVFVCSSRVESYPRVVLEAMAYDLPIVTTPVYGITEQVVEEINALLYAPGDTARLCEHLVTLVRDDKKRRALSDNARAVLGTLTSFERMLDQYERVFTEAHLASVA